MPAIIEALARLDGRPFPSIDTFGRFLRSGGFLSHGGRGTAAPHATPDDVANLVIGIMATDSPTAAPRVVDTFRALVRLPEPEPEGVTRALGLLIRLPSFGEFLAGAFDYAGTLRRELGDSGIELQISRTVPAAGLLLRDASGRRRMIAQWVVDVRRHGARASVAGAEAGEDRRLTAAISQRTIFALGDLLARDTVEVDR
ncbi:hypothetical protein [Methylobacterium oryzae]|uniref:hypothetical protein n=1 Tax=Methylobacterium oryzae TaxID=334852 RepID=UPI001F2B1BEA|nr:hypothetical protein [Methylobacterium oryzae]UIN36296.1 hypothetical protein LXM90_07290 [Methylobacterium oryzae]